MVSEERSSYELGWSDGYAEGYGCKLADATEPFNPQALARVDAVEAIARHLRRKFARYFSAPDDAIGAARGIVTALNEDTSHGK